MSRDDIGGMAFTVAERTHAGRQREMNQDAAIVAAN